MSLHNRVNTLESTGRRREVFICKDDPYGGAETTGSARPAPGGGWELLHGGQWMPSREVERRGIEPFIIHVKREARP
jgi:hypothetical protein